jgi:thymidylate synthase (FAD)
MIAVDFIDSMGSDDRVADAARVSFDKAAANYTRGQNARLLAYLAEHDHWSPFSHCFATFRVKAPFFVARQLQKHTVGLAWNEISRRYVDSPPEFYDPGNWRVRARNLKQGSGEGVVASPAALVAYEEAMGAARGAYETLIAVGVAPEQARMVLPMATMTEWYWSGSLAAWARVCRLRLAPDAQGETREVASEISRHMADLFPLSWAALAGWRPAQSEAGGNAA